MFSSLLPWIFPTGLAAFVVYKLLTDENRESLLRYSILLAGGYPVLWFEFKPIDFPWNRIFLVLILGMIGKTLFAKKTRPLNSRDLMPLFSALIVFGWLAFEFSETPTRGFLIDRPLITGHDTTLIALHSGTTPILNRHRDLDRNHFAIDIGEKTDFSDLTGILSGDNTQFGIYGKPVLSPCPGRILAVENTVPDKAPGFSVKGAHEGNFIEMECIDKDLALIVRFAGLQPDSLARKAGDAVAQGDVIGKVGNSGYQGAPHLHIDVTEKVSGRPYPVFFKGKFLRTGDEL